MSKVLVLYSELAGYIVACMKEYISTYQGEMHVVRWPVNPVAPFRFEDMPGLKYYERQAMDEAAMIRLGEEIQPDAIYITGWIDKAYLKVAAHFRKKGLPVIAAFDTQWRGDLRQRLAVAMSPFYFRRIFSHAWVPGLYQYEYARRLGFDRTHILTGMYAADTRLFEAAYPQAIAQKALDYPRTLLYVGRMDESKGLPELYAAFQSLSDTERQGWQLRLVGTGPLRQTLKPTPTIHLQDFVQPEELPALAHTAGAFILPSRFEPWGVVVHEFAAAGLPLLCSDAVGAGTAFLRPGYNGLLHPQGDQAAIKDMLKRFFALPPAQWLEMGKRSHALAQQISPSTWAANLEIILQQN